MKKIRSVLGATILSLMLLSGCSEISDEDAYNWGYNLGYSLAGGTSTSTVLTSETVLSQSENNLMPDNNEDDYLESNSIYYFPEYENPFLVLPFDRSSTSNEINDSLQQYNLVVKEEYGFVLKTVEDVALFGGVPVDITGLVINKNGTIKAFTLKWSRIVENSGIFGTSYKYSRNDPLWHLKVKCSLKKELMTYDDMQGALNGGLDMLGYYKDDLVTLKNDNYPEVSFLYHYYYPDYEIRVDFDGITYFFTDNNGIPIDNTKRINCSLTEFPFDIADYIHSNELTNNNYVTRVAEYEANLYLNHLNMFIPVYIQCYLDEESRVETIYIESSWLNNISPDIISDELNQKSDNKSWILPNGNILRFEANSLSIRPQGQIEIDGGWD